MRMLFVLLKLCVVFRVEDATAKQLRSGFASQQIEVLNMVDTAADVGNLSLAAAYDRVNELLDGPDGTSAASPDTAQEALQLLSHCELLVQRAALFSSNEDADDLITSQLKYLLVRSKRCHGLHVAVAQPAAAVRSRHLSEP